MGIGKKHLICHLRCKFIICPKESLSSSQDARDLKKLLKEMCWCSNCQKLAIMKKLLGLLELTRLI
jgi:hypothetical protein